VALCVRGNLVLERVLAGFVGVGSVSALAYARRTTLALGAIVAQGVNTVALSEMSRSNGERVPRDSGMILTTGVRLVLFLSVPVAALVVLFHSPVTELLYGGRRFGGDVLAQTARLISLFGLALPMYVLVPLLLSAFYAEGDTRTPSNHNLLVLVLNAGLNLVLVWRLGVSGIAVSFLTAQAGSVARAWRLVRRRADRIRGVGLYGLASRLAAGVLALALAAYLLFSLLSFLGFGGRMGTLVALSLSSVVGLLAFVSVMWALNVGEALWLVTAARGLVDRLPRRGTTGQ
jgi:putative peptidoglycan lipid II flippase